MWDWLQYLCCVCCNLSEQDPEDQVLMLLALARAIQTWEEQAINDFGQAIEDIPEQITTEDRLQARSFTEGNAEISIHAYDYDGMLVGRLIIPAFDGTFADREEAKKLRQQQFFKAQRVLRYLHRKLSERDRIRSYIIEWSHDPVNNIIAHQRRYHYDPVTKKVVQTWFGFRNPDETSVDVELEDQPQRDIELKETSRYYTT